MSELSPTELVTYLAHIAEDGVSDGVAGRNIVRHFESQRQRIAQLEAEVAKWKEKYEAVVTWNDK